MEEMPVFLKEVTALKMCLPWGLGSETGLEAASSRVGSPCGSPPSLPERFSLFPSYSPAVAMALLDPLHSWLD